MPARDPDDIAAARQFDWVVGVNIRYWREVREMSQAELAECANISDSQLSRIESGERSLTLQQGNAISKALKVPLSALWARIEGMKQNIVNVDSVL